MAPCQWRYYLYLWNPHALFRLVQNDFECFYLELLLIPAIAVFLLLKLMRHFSFTRILLRKLTGAAAIAFFPLGCLFCFYRDRLPLLFGGVELAIAVVCFFSWAYRKWLILAPLNIVLTFHYVFWAFAFWDFYLGGLGHQFRPRAWGIWDYAFFIVPAFGLCYSLAWAKCFRRSDEAQISVATKT